MTRSPEYPRLDRERVEKIAALQRLVTEAVESGVSPRSMQDILAEARKQIGRGV